ncbi:MAG: anti-sigma factor [Flavobacteriaceae bacterium]|nr:anti-sigma factor [Flavobacteriaceae bacterium]
MNEEEIIASGLLELYVTGSLSEEDKLKVDAAIQEFPNLKEEIEQIEAALMQLSESTSTGVSNSVWQRIVNRISGVRPLNAQRPRRNWNAITGWAAAILCFGGLFWMMKQNSDLKDRLRTTNTKNVVLEEKLENSDSRLTQSKELLEVYRSDDFKPVYLPGNQDVAPSAFATVYYSDEEKIAYVDAYGLPEPPQGKVYQVWSLTMNPLTPTSIGLLDTFDDNELKFFKVESVAGQEAFGITLEPEGGSEFPTLEQLYTLGTISP